MLGISNRVGITVICIKTERAIVHVNRELICLYEGKIKKVIERVWES